ncbi:manganese transporter [Desulfuribacillus alkaliarsenatis]|uniref:Manganese transporter n=2 Tax=Desulfuribacillus alkaliarsenatis TaxID=766136 RepID=A0A1E5G6C4_9FIRM|nr:manganese transporter [Desulfuribacillus alkaliarsenatis]
MIVGCNQSNSPTGLQVQSNDELYVITTLSILADMAKNVVGEYGKVEYIVPVGNNPEDYELIPSDIRRIDDADVLFVNGLGLEETIIESLGNVGRTQIAYVTDGVPTINLIGSSDPDPHAWLDVSLAKIYVENIYKIVAEIDPANSQHYSTNADAYISELNKLDSYIKDTLNSIPENNRVIVISENAMKYFGDAYGFHTEGIWELNSHEEGTPQQISRIIEIVNDRNLPAIFSETTLDPRYMEMISKETGVPIAGSLYTDALGYKGSEGDTYIKMMKYNTNLLVEGLR